MNRYLNKVAELVSQDTKKDLVNTGTLGAVGGLEGLAMGKLFSHPRFAHMGVAKKFGIGTGVTLAADYGALQVAKGLNRIGQAKENK